MKADVSLPCYSISISTLRSHKRHLTSSIAVTPLVEFVHLCDHYCGKALKFLVNIGSFGAVTGAAIVYLILISGLESDIGMVAYRECEIFNIKPFASVSSYCLLIFADGMTGNITWESIRNVTCAAHPDLLGAEEADNSIIGIMLRKKVLLFVNAVLFFVPFTFVSASTFRKINAFGSVCNVLLVIIVLFFAFSWGLNLDFYDTDAEFYMPLVQPRFFRLTGVLSMGLFLHNAVITLVSATKDQKNNVRTYYVHRQHSTYPIDLNEILNSALIYFSKEISPSDTVWSPARTS